MECNHAAGNSTCPQTGYTHQALGKTPQMTLPEDRVRKSPKVSRISPAAPTVVYDTYWSFAVERQEVFFRRLEECPPPWTPRPNS